MCTTLKHSQIPNMITKVNVDKVTKAQISVAIHVSCKTDTKKGMTNK